MKKTIIIIILLMVPLANRSVVSEQWWNVYFTSPGISKARDKKTNPEKGIIDLINDASISIYGAFYDISSARVVEALIRAKKRGVDVKLVTENDNYDRKGITDLIRAGIPIVIDKGNGLMHNKFAVIDGRIVWTGSYNLTENDAVHNDNNALAVASGELAELFLGEFNEMFFDKIFGNRSWTGLLELPFFNSINSASGDLIVYFSPEDDVEDRITEYVMNAEKSIQFMAFSFTSDKIGDAMVEMHGKGVKVSGVFEKTGTGTKFSEYIKLKTAGIPVFLDKNIHLMHHKIIIIDGCIVILGSFNFSKNANERNDENTIVIFNVTIAHAYLEECERLIK